MDKYITIDYPYKRIVLTMPNPKPLLRVLNVHEWRVLNVHEWDLLARCEAPYYQNDPGGHAMTDVTRREESQEIAVMWDSTYDSAAACAENPDDKAEVERETARRLAAAFAILAFGKEFLLK